MDVNNIFSQIADFWDRISIPIFFHVIFFVLFSFIFGKLYIKKSVENYIQSESFKRTKVILTEFELWKKLPLLLIIGALIYLTLFNSVTGQMDSVRVFPFNVTYSNPDFIKEYEPKENILEIAKYGKDTIPDLFKVDLLKEKLLEEYKGKYPDKYNSWVKWTKDKFGSQNRYFHLTFLTITSLFVILLVRLFQKRRKRKFVSIFKFILILILSIPILFLLRYREEQSIEESFCSEIMFVKTSLETDPSRQVVLDSVQLKIVEVRLTEEFRNRQIFQPQLWVSRIVGRSETLQNLLGRRKLRNVVNRNDDLSK